MIVVFCQDRVEEVVEFVLENQFQFLVHKQAYLMLKYCWLLSPFQLAQVLVVQFVFRSIDVLHVYDVEQANIAFEVVVVFVKLAAAAAAAVVVVVDALVQSKKTFYRDHYCNIN